MYKHLYEFKQLLYLYELSMILHNCTLILSQKYYNN